MTSDSTTTLRLVSRRAQLKTKARSKEGSLDGELWMRREFQGPQRSRVQRRSRSQCKGSKVKEPVGDKRLHHGHPHGGVEKSATESNNQPVKQVNENSLNVFEIVILGIFYQCKFKSSRVISASLALSSDAVLCLSTC